jgi:hypothetical protein
MKKVKLFEEFTPNINEGITFGKKGIAAKLQDKLRIAKMAIEKWGSNYDGQLARVEKAIKSGKIDFKDKLMIQGDDAQDNYDIFQSSNATDLAKRVAKVINKYKKHETEESSVRTAAGWSGSMRSTVGGKIEGRSNFNNGGKRNYLIAVTIGGGISSSVKDSIKQELYELFFIFDEYNSSDGGVMISDSSGTNYDTIGLTNSAYSFNKGTADNLIKIMNY